MYEAREKYSVRSKTKSSAPTNSIISLALCRSVGLQFPEFLKTEKL